MPEYKAPLRDYKFVTQEVFDCETHYEKLGYEDVNNELMDSIFTEAAKFVENVVAPINQTGDDGCRWEDGNVITPEGFKDAYAQYVEGGWPTLSHPEDFGGQGLPSSLAKLISEMVSAANHSFAMFPGLSEGCIATLEAWGTEEQQHMFLPKMVEGVWTGTMCLTESHCGTDLGLLRTKAEPQEDGSYQLNGTKIFISAGEHDLSENIIHLVIARIPGSPEGTKGISLFLVPKFNIDTDGNILERNGVNCGSIEHKMGIHGSPTCVINFDNAKGYLIGEVNRGLNNMFTFMNAARISVAGEGVAAAEASFQGALAYAKDRLQMRSLSGPKNPDGYADPIIVHPDVRRMLLTQKSIAEGGRAFATYLSQDIDTVLVGKNEEDVQKANNRLALLTPIAKAFLTEIAFECTSHGVQVFGGHGYVKEWGMEQLMRDTRISMLYEGTTGIQAIDLLGRKVLGSRGKLLEEFAEEMVGYCKSVEATELTGAMMQSLMAQVTNLGKLTQKIAGEAQSNPDEVGAASFDYLMLCGYVMVAYMWLRMSVVAEAKLKESDTDKDFYQAKLQTAKFYFDRILPRAEGHLACIKSGGASMMAMDEEHFAF